MSFNVTPNGRDPSWSPDYQRIAYQTSSTASDIYIIDAGCIELAEGCNSHSTNLTQDLDGRARKPAWSPDGKQIVFSYSEGANQPPKLWVMNSDGSGKRLLVDIHGSYPAWSPDGKTIAFEGHARGTKFVPDQESQCVPCGNVFLVDSDGANLRRLTPLLPDSWDPAWSPDGQRIALVSANGFDLSDPNRFSLIYIVNADGTQPLLLANGQAYGISPKWSPDGSRILFQGLYPLENGFYGVEVSTGTLTMIRAESEIEGHWWSP